MTDSAIISSQPIIITGMHRSGTSLTASVLEKAGVNIGEDLLGSHRGNARGHFEDINFLTLHQDILVSQGISSEGWTTHNSVEVPQQFWGRSQALCQQRAEQDTLWGWKEPRTTLFLNFWATILPNAKFVFLYRSPWEVIDSLFARGDVAFHHNPKFAIEVWIAYNQAVLDFYQRHSEKAFLLHPLFLKDGENEFITRLSQKLELPLSPFEEHMFEAKDMHLQVNNTHRPALLTRYFPEAIELFKRLEKAADLPSPMPIDTLLDMAAKGTERDWSCQDWLASRRASALYEEAQSVHDELQQARVELQQAHAELQRTQAELHHTQAGLEHTQAAFQQSQADVHRLNTELHQNHLQLQQAQFQLQQTHAELQQEQAARQHAELVIQAMETSKFWKLRNSWTNFKSIFRLSQTS
jgi:hypothetical protein